MGARSGGRVWRRRGVAVSLLATTATIGIALGATPGSAISTNGTQWTSTQTPSTTFSVPPPGAVSKLGPLSVALSADGRTALVGVPSAYNGDGVVNVYRASGAGQWNTTPVAILGDASSSSTPAGVGQSVALSADGTTAVTNCRTMSTCVFHVSSPSAWRTTTTPTATLTHSGPNSFSGVQASVAVSGDGATVLVGAPLLGSGYPGGAAYIFHAASEPSWTDMASPTATLTEEPNPFNDDEFGSSVAISDDGTTALVSDPYTPGGGAGFVYHVSSATAWTTTGSPTAKLNYPGTSTFDPPVLILGSGVGLSGDGTLAVLGGDSAPAAGPGFVYRAATSASWSSSSTPTAILNMPYNAPDSVAVSAQGNTVILGSPPGETVSGAAYLFEVGSESSWTGLIAPTATLTNAAVPPGFRNGGTFGAGTAVSADGSTVAIGNDNRFSTPRWQAYLYRETPPASAYWMAGARGDVYAFGPCCFFGSMAGRPLNAPITTMAATPDGGGYWLVGSDGGIYGFGDAGYFGSMGGQPLNAPITGITATPDGGGYWLVGSDGGIFAFGDAGFYGSMGGQPLNQPVVGMAATRDGMGYALVASDGGFFAFGDAGFYGSMGGHPLNQSIVGIALSPDNGGYWMVAGDGGIFAFGDANFLGSVGGQPLPAPVVGMAS